MTTAEDQLRLLRRLADKTIPGSDYILNLMAGVASDQDWGVTKGALGAAAILTTDDCQAVYDALTAKGVEFTQGVEVQPYGTDCAFRDPFGNHIRVTQLAAMPAEISDADIARWGGPPDR
jgi:hypothetical protein